MIEYDWCNDIINDIMIENYNDNEEDLLVMNDDFILLWYYWLLGSIYLKFSLLIST